MDRHQETPQEFNDDEHVDTEDLLNVDVRLLPLKELEKIGNALEERFREIIKKMNEAEQYLERLKVKARAIQDQFDAAEEEDNFPAKDKLSGELYEFTDRSLAWFEETISGLQRSLEEVGSQLADARKFERERKEGMEKKH